MLSKAVSVTIDFFKQNIPIIKTKLRLIMVFLIGCGFYQTQDFLNALII